MVNSCAAYRCQARWKKRDGPDSIRFYKFPHGDPKRLKQWVAAMRRKGWHPTKHHVICSQHFQLSDFRPRKSSDARVMLRDTAVPSIFDFPPYLKKTNKPRRTIIRHVFPSMPLKKKGVGNDHSYFASYSKMQKINEKKDVRKVQLQRNIQTLRQKVRRQKQKTNRLQHVIQELKDRYILKERACKILTDSLENKS